MYTRAVLCVNCGHRLFDAQKGDVAHLTVKCPVCGRIDKVEVADKYITPTMPDTCKVKRGGVVRDRLFKPVRGGGDTS